MRQLTKYYLRSGEDKDAFMKQAMALVRLSFEEAWHRCLLGAQGKVMRPALCSIVVTMKDFEEDTLGANAADLGVLLDIL